MKYCAYCGCQITNDAAFCPSCGSKVESNNNDLFGFDKSTNNSYNPNSYGNNSNNQYNSNTNFGNQPTQKPNQYFGGSDNSYSNKNQKGDFGWAILGFIMPLIGFILFLVWRKDRPGDSRYAGKGVLVRVILSVVMTILFVVLVSCLASNADMYDDVYVYNAMQTITSIL